MLPVVYAPHYEVDLGAHVFPTDKWRRAYEMLQPQLQAAQVHEPQPAERAALERVHTAAYLDDFLSLEVTPRTVASELPLTAAIRDAYILATGGTMLAATLALQHGAAMHLGGGYHHAMADHAEGFCYLNDVAVAVRWLQSQGDIQRAAVIDTDVHQGNGTARIFEGDASVFTFSIHQENNYPIKERSDLDLGLRDGVEDAEYLQHLEDHVPELLDTQAPDLVMMVAGADPYREDLLGGLALSLEGLQRRDALVIDACRQRGIPVVGTTAGGYARHVEDTARIHAQTCRELMRVTGT